MNRNAADAWRGGLGLSYVQRSEFARFHGLVLEEWREG